MQSTISQTTSLIAEGDPLGFIKDLESGGALTAFQAGWLIEHWPNLPDEWPSHPLLRTTREHTRAYIEQAGQRALCVATTAPTTTKESDAPCHADHLKTLSECSPASRLR